MLANFDPSPELSDLLGETGLALVRERMFDAVGDCLTCQQPLAGTPTTVSVKTFPDGHLYVRAHHASCPEPPADNSPTYIVSGLGLGGMPMLLVHPSAEVLWLRREPGDDRWVHTTATGFTDLGFATGIPGSPDVQQELVPNATLQLAGTEVTIDVPPTHRWRAQVIEPVAALIRGAGGALVLISTGTDQQSLDNAELGALFTAGDYVAGVVDHAPLGQSRARRAHDELRHPMYFISSPSVNARTVFLDDPEVGWAAGRVDATGQLQRAGLDFDRIPMVLLETPSSISLGTENTGKDHLVENVIDSGLNRIGPTDPGPMNPLPGWEMTYRLGELQLRAAAGPVVVGKVTPQPQWLSAALGHGAVLALYGPVLGVRDTAEEGTRDSDADARRNELRAARAAGLVAGGMITFRLAEQSTDADRPRACTGVAADRRYWFRDARAQ